MTRVFRPCWFALRHAVAPWLVVFGGLQFLPPALADNSDAYGLNARVPTKAYLQMPLRADGMLPPLLSQTGAFADTTRALPVAALVPYDLIVPFWSDGAEKFRWISVPDDQRMKFSPAGDWTFPRGTVFVKTFTLATNEA